MKKSEQPLPVDDIKMWPLAVYHNGDIHDALANLRKIDGNISIHDKYGDPVN
jgi:hypothetical protein